LTGSGDGKKAVKGNPSMLFAAGLG